MPVAKHLLTLLVAVLAFPLGGCGAEDAQIEAGVVPPTDPPSTTSGWVDAAGATLSLTGLTLEIPPGALDEPVEVTIEPIDPPYDRAVGQWYRFHPTGLTFAVPARLTVLDVEPTEDLVKWIDRLDDQGQPRRAVQILPQTDTAGGRQAELLGFSEVGATFSIFTGGCRRLTVPPRVTRASYDACADELSLAWESDASVVIQFGYRPGYRAGDPIPPVQWLSMNTFEEDGTLRRPTPVSPAPDQLAYTFVFRVHQSDSCGGTTLLSPPATAAIPAPQILRPPAPTEVRVIVLDGANRIQWNVPTSTAGHRVGFDGFEIERRPPWPEGIRRVDPTQRGLTDVDLSPSVRYAYSVRSVRDVTSCATSVASAWEAGDGAILPPVPAGPTVEQMCGRVRITVAPAEQTMQAQNAACLANGTCPNAVIGVTIEDTSGAPLSPLEVGVMSPRELLEADLITVDSLFSQRIPAPGQPFAFLVDGTASEFFATISIATPADLLTSAGLTPPTTWNVGIFTGDCLLAAQVIVQ